MKQAARAILIVCMRHVLGMGISWGMRVLFRVGEVRGKTHVSAHQQSLFIQVALAIPIK